MRRTALITGVLGQDGAYLASLLIRDGLDVVGVTRPNSQGDKSRLAALGIADRVEIARCDLGSLDETQDLISKWAPHEVYNLAGNSSVAQSFQEPARSLIDDVGLATNLIEAVRTRSPASRIHLALSSEIFGAATSGPQTEEDAPCPQSPYGQGKACVWQILKMYRNLYDMHVSGGIFYNHESPLRGEHFVTRKIIKGFVHAVCEQGPPVSLGNIDARRDWGFAGDYTKAMIEILRRDQPDDFIVASGRSSSVRQFCEQAACALGTRIEWIGAGLDEVGRCADTGRPLVRIEADFYRPADSTLLVGDNTKLSTKTGWRPAKEFGELIAFLIEFEVARLRNAVLTPADHWDLAPARAVTPLAG